MGIKNTSKDFSKMASFQKNIVHTFLIHFLSRKSFWPKNGKLFSIWINNINESLQKRTFSYSFCNRHIKLQFKQFPSHKSNWFWKVWWIQMTRKSNFLSCSTKVLRKQPKRFFLIFSYEIFHATEFYRKNVGKNFKLKF